MGYSIIHLWVICMQCAGVMLHKFHKVRALKCFAVISAFVKARMIFPGEPIASQLSGIIFPSGISADAVVEFCSLAEPMAKELAALKCRSPLAACLT